MSVIYYIINHVIVELKSLNYVIKFNQDLFKIGILQKTTKTGVKKSRINQLSSLFFKTILKSSEIFI